MQAVKELLIAVTEIEYLTLLWWGFFGGVTLSVVALVFRQKPLDFAAAGRITQCGLEGAAAAAGLHLLFCGLDPTKLVEIVKADGGHVALEAGHRLKIDALHAIHLGAGGVATVLIALVGLTLSCRHDHQ